MPMNKQRGNMKYHKLPNIEVLRRFYVDQKLSTLKIASQYGATPRAVATKLKRAGMEIRSLSDSQSLIANYIKLTKNLIYFLDGLLLGDGSLIMASRQKSVCYSHTDKNRSYLEWLAVQLVKFGLGVAKIRKNGNAFAIRTKYYRDLKWLRNHWYPHGRKKVPVDIEITPTILRNWYIGDGSYRKGKINKNGVSTKKGERVLIAMEFDKEGKERLSGKLTLLGFSNTIHHEGIYIRARDRNSFFKFMLSDNLVIPECYKYKFPRRTLCH